MEESPTTMGLEHPTSHRNGGASESDDDLGHVRAWRSSVWALAVLAGAASGCDGTLGTYGPDAGLPLAVSDAGVLPSPVDDASVVGDAGVVDGGAVPGLDGGGPAPRPGDIPLFVAQGHNGRTTFSCDDGRNWIGERSLDPDVRCFEDGVDCDHQSGSGHGVVYGEGYFVASFGWGEPGSIVRSRDGVAWETVVEGTTFGDMSFGPDPAGQGVFLAGARRAQRSVDLGMTFEATGDTALEGYNVRGSGYVPVGTGMFILIADGEATFSVDGGETFETMPSLPEECMAGVGRAGGIAYGNGTIVVLGRTGAACRSVDGGTQWDMVQTADSVHSTIVSSDGRFLFWASEGRWSSADGAAWQSDETEPADLRLGALALSPDGTFVAVNGGWRRWYEEQVFYRSVDGLLWEALPDANYVHGTRSGRSPSGTARRARGALDSETRCQGRPSVGGPDASNVPSK